MMNALPSRLERVFLPGLVVNKCIIAETEAIAVLMLECEHLGGASFAQISDRRYHDAVYAELLIADGIQHFQVICVFCRSATFRVPRAPCDVQFL